MKKSLFKHFKIKFGQSSKLFLGVHVYCFIVEPKTGISYFSFTNCIFEISKAFSVCSEPTETRNTNDGKLSFFPIRLGENLSFVGRNKIEEVADAKSHNLFKHFF